MRQPRRFGGKRLTGVVLMGCMVLGLALAGHAEAPTPQASPKAVAAATPSPLGGGPSATPAVSTEPIPSGQRLLALPTPVSDAQALADWRADGTVGKSTFIDRIRKVTWTLALICFLIWGVGKVAGKATLQRWGLPVEADSLIEVLEKKRLSPGRSIMLLRVGPKVLAVAATESGYTTLTEIDSESLKQYQDEKIPPEPKEEPTTLGHSPADLAKHYLSIIPGLGAKK